MMTLLKLHSESLKDDWLDGYGHLNDGYYTVPFGNASWAFADHLQIGVEYFKQTGCAFYTVEAHLRYLKEVRSPAVLEIDSMVFGADAKRLRLAHIMKVDGIERATFECVMLHFDTKVNRTAAMPDNVHASLKQLEIAVLPDWAGQGISLEKK